MLNPFIVLLGDIIDIYSFIILIWVIVSLLLHFEVINRFNPLIRQIFTILTQLVEPALKPLRRLQWKLLPQLTAVDLSPIILLLLLGFAKNALFTWFYDPQPYDTSDKVIEEQVRAINEAVEKAKKDRDED